MKIIIRIVKNNLINICVIIYLKQKEQNLISCRTNVGHKKLKGMTSDWIPGILKKIYMKMVLGTNLIYNETQEKDEFLKNI